LFTTCTLNPPLQPLLYDDADPFTTVVDDAVFFGAWYPVRPQLDVTGGAAAGTTGMLLTTYDDRGCTAAVEVVVAVVDPAEFGIYPVDEFAV
jgi:hypothetical protein